MNIPGIKIVNEHNERTVVTRRNELMLAPFRLSLWAQRLFLYVISQVEDEQPDDYKYVFSVAHLARKVGVENPNLYRGLLEIIDELERVKVLVPAIDGKGMLRIGLIKNRQRIEMPSAASPDPRRKEGRLYLDGMVSLELWGEVMPYIKDLRERYTDIELRYAFLLRSTFGQKLYDILKTQEFHRRAFTITLKDLRAMLGVGDGFERYPDFRRFVLERAQADINEHTDVRFTFQPGLVGKKVETLTFTITKGHEPRVAFLPASRADDLYHLLTKAGLSARQAVAAVEAWGTSDPERISWHLAEMRRKEAAGEIRKAPLAWLRAGLKTDYRPRGLSPHQRRLEDAERERDRSRRNRISVNSGARPIGAVLEAMRATLQKQNPSDHEAAPQR